jgi:RNA polymerase sporulation-specific sigma factor
MAKAKKSRLKIIPLGGVDGIGRNITVFECGEDIIVVDCGISFAEADTPGVDFVIPDISYLEGCMEKVRGIFVTHGHEDHIGAIPFFLKRINVPVYATRLTLGILENKLIEHNMRLVSHIIRKYYSSYGAQDELLSIGSLGLIKAVDSFKSELGTRFATYGAKCIQNEILMFFRASKKNSNEISINETIDIDKDGNPLTYLDIISIEDTTCEDIELKMYVDKLQKLVDESLTGREKEIIVLRYGLKGYEPKTQREVAKHLKISRSYVSRIEKRALDILREKFGTSVPHLDT